MNLEQKECYTNIIGLLDLKIHPDTILQSVCQILFDTFNHFDWVGFYIAKDGMLHLGPFVGEPTEHIQIEFGKGVCGQAALQKKTMTIADVKEESNYLSCSLSVRSEIVIPIIKEDQFVAEIDIDSHQKNAFSEGDKIFLEKIARRLEILF